MKLQAYALDTNLCFFMVKNFRPSVSVFSILQFLYYYVSSSILHCRNKKYNF